MTQTHGICVARRLPRARIHVFLQLLTVLLLCSVPTMVQAQFAYTTNNESITITGYGGSGGDVIIPAAINGLPVTKIGTLAFYRCFSLTSITIPTGVTGLENGAFEDCTNLTSLTFGSSLASIGENAFLRCSSLTNFTIANSVTTIGSWAFGDCASLATVSIPNSVSTIGDWAFEWCGSLTTVTIPNSVSSLGHDVFSSCKNLTCVTIGDSVTNIGGGAFIGCYSLTNVAIGKSVTSIGEWSFCGCTNLVSVTIPDSVTTIEDGAFAGCHARLTGLYFRGNAPTAGVAVLDADESAIVYCLPGTTNWGTTYCGRPTVLWNPAMQGAGGQFGVASDNFGFMITGTTNIPIVVEAAADLASNSWTLLQSCTLTNGSLYFSDADWTNLPVRFYRIRSP
jgi:hypothetical protein